MFGYFCVSKNAENKYPNSKIGCSNSMQQSGAVKKGISAKSAEFGY